MCGRVDRCARLACAALRANARACGVALSALWRGRVVHTAYIRKVETNTRLRHSTRKTALRICHLYVAASRHTLSLISHAPHEARAALHTHKSGPAGLRRSHIRSHRSTTATSKSRLTLCSRRSHESRTSGLTYTGRHVHTHDDLRIHVRVTHPRSYGHSQHASSRTVSRVSLLGHMSSNASSL